MCGIAGIIAFSDEGKKHLSSIKDCGKFLFHRGPDNQHFTIQNDFALAHARLSIIDLSEKSNQPFTSRDNRFTIIYNGEIFNYKQLRDELKQKGHPFYTEGDAEVLINLYREYGKEGLHKINGFFAFLLADNNEKKFIAARDRFGVKPFYYFTATDFFACASEMRTLKHLSNSTTIDKAALFTYLQLTYIPDNACLLEGIKKLQPGSLLFIENGKVIEQKYFHLQLPRTYPTSGQPTKKFLELLQDAVEQRLVSDVPVGSFLSGGIDSGVITALAARNHQDLQTFSIGFKGNGHFDESPWAEMVAKKYKTLHHTFHFTEAEAENEIGNFLDSIDEPFADSSAFNVFLLAKKTKEHVKVALSGDGADELLAGYNKHRAEWMIRHNKSKTLLLKSSGVLAKFVPSSRGGKLSNKARQLQRFAAGAKLPADERYWRWASFYSAEGVSKLLPLSAIEKQRQDKIKHHYTSLVNEDYNSLLLADLQLVLPGDMLVKVDRMSMAHGLEVRNPFLDYRLVEFITSLPSQYKIDGRTQKKLIRESCRHLLPAEIWARKKHGFETPVQIWLKGILRNHLDELLLNKTFIREQGLFDSDEISKVVKKALGTNPGDATAETWALLVFNYWYKKHLM